MTLQGKMAGVVVVGFGVTLLAFALLEPRHEPSFPQGVPITEQQLRQKLEAAGYAYVKIERDRTYLKATAVKDGRQESIAVDATDGQDVSVVVNDVD